MLIRLLFQGKIIVHDWWQWYGHWIQTFAAVGVVEATRSCKGWSLCSNGWNLVGIGLLLFNKNSFFSSSSSSAKIFLSEKLVPVGLLYVQRRLAWRFRHGQLFGGLLVG